MIDRENPWFSSMTAFRTCFPIRAFVQEIARNSSAPLSASAPCNVRIASASISRRRRTAR
jgi:hypothetical protein